MIETLTKEQIALQREQEARTFVGRNGEKYVCHHATTGEKKYFEGTLYHSGIPDLVLISYMTAAPLY